MKIRERKIKAPLKDKQRYRLEKKNRESLIKFIQKANIKTIRNEKIESKHSYIEPGTPSNPLNLQGYLRLIPAPFP